ncbi:MAG: divalent-cation tolerance protein CutA [bacterium]|nr:divalent-cation tolerance protein CutA [bacterium]
MDIIVIYCTVPNKKLAKEITKVLMKHRLAACVSMIENVKSVFSWDGEICEEKEVLLMIKTRRANYGKIKLVIEDMHSYSVPEIIALPIVDCSEDYLKWLAKETALQD